MAVRMIFLAMKNIANVFGETDDSEIRTASALFLTKVWIPKFNSRRTSKIILNKVG